MVIRHVVARTHHPETLTYATTLDADRRSSRASWSAADVLHTIILLADRSLPRGTSIVRRVSRGG